MLCLITSALQLEYQLNCTESQLDFTFLKMLPCFLPLQMVCSCCFLYVLRRWRIISFTAGESVIMANNSKKFVPLKTLKNTLPLAGAYLLYMACRLFLLSKGRNFNCDLLSLFIISFTPVFLVNS